MTWLKALLKAGLAGGLIIVSPFAAQMAVDGYTAGEARALLAQFINGGIAGMAGMFVQAPRNQNRRDRATDEGDN